MDETCSFDDLSDDDLLRWSEWARRSPISRSEAHARIQEGRFPAPIKIGNRASAWRVGDLRAWRTDPAGWRAPGVTEIKPRCRRQSWPRKAQVTQ